jgi:PAS domain S-box-containing protein
MSDTASKTSQNSPNSAQEPSKVRSLFSHTTTLALFFLIGINLFWVSATLPLILRGRSLPIPLYLTEVFVSFLFVFACCGVLLKARLCHLQDASSKQAKLIQKVRHEYSHKEKMLEEVQTLAQVGNWCYEYEADTIHWSPQTFIIFEQDAASGVIRGQEFLALLPLEDRERLLVCTEQVKTDRQKYEIEYCYVTKKNSRKYLREFGAPYYDIEGNLIGIYGAVQDITEQVLAEQTLRESHEQLEALVAERTKALEEQRHLLRLIIENIPLYLFWKDREGRYLGCNTNYLEAHYFDSPEQILGKTDAELYADSDLQEESLETDRRVLAGEPIVHNIVPFNAAHAIIKWIDVNKTPIQDEFGKIIGLLGYFEDVTERVRAEGQILEQRLLLQKVIDTDPNLIYVTNHEGAFVLVNRATAEFFGLSAEDIVGQSEIELLSTEQGNDTSLYALRSAQTTLQETFIPECRVVTPQGEVRWLQIIKRPLVHSTEEIPQMLGIATDITARKRIEEDLLRAKVSAEVANQAKSQLISSMSHELRTPLNAILGFSELLADNEVGELNPRQKRYADNILTSGKQLLRLINDVLDLAKLDARRLELDYSIFDPSMALESAIALVRQAAMDKHITIAIQCEERIPSLSADQQRFKQVLYTLIGNAIKFTPERGAIQVEMSLLGEEEPLLHIAVSDAGIGIKNDDLKRIFYETEPLEPAEKHKYTGIRIGLALTRRLVEAHEGRVWAESTNTKAGSTFHFTLPIKGRAYPLVMSHEESLAPHI